MTAAASLFALALTLLAQIQPIPDPVRWSLSIKNQRPVAPGAAVLVNLNADIRPGWRLYSIAEPPGGPIATEISLAAGQPFTFAKPIVAPKAHAIFDANFGMSLELYTGTVDFGVPIKISATARSGTGTLTVEMRYQSCNETMCLSPRRARSTLAVQIR